MVKRNMRLAKAIYFSDKIDTYNIIGFEGILRSTLHLKRLKGLPTPVLFHALFIFAGQSEYFAQKQVPLSFKEYKKKYPKIQAYVL